MRVIQELCQIGHLLEVTIFVTQVGKNAPLTNINQLFIEIFQKRKITF